MAVYQVCLHLPALSMATAERSGRHVCAQNSFSSSSQEPHTCFAASCSGNLPSTHTYAQISGRSNTVSRARVSSWAHFRFHQWRCSKDSRIMTHTCPCCQKPSPLARIFQHLRAGHRPAKGNSHGAKNKQGLPTPLWHFFQSDFQPSV